MLTSARATLLRLFHLTRVVFFAASVSGLGLLLGGAEVDLRALCFVRAMVLVWLED